MPRPSLPNWNLLRCLLPCQSRPHLLQPILLRRALRFAGGLPRHIWGFWSIWDHRFIDYWMNNHKSRAKKLMFTKAALTHRVPLIFHPVGLELDARSLRPWPIHITSLNMWGGARWWRWSTMSCGLFWQEIGPKIAPKLGQTHVMDTFGWDDPKWGSGSVEMLISCLETPPFIRCPNCFFVLYPTYSDNFVSQDPEQEASSAAGARISPWHLWNLCPICRWFSHLFSHYSPNNMGDFPMSGLIFQKAPSPARVGYARSWHQHKHLGVGSETNQFP